MNILILSAGTRNKIIQYFKKEFKNIGRVLATDMSELAPAIYEADKYYIMPRIDDPTYIEKLIEVCKKEDINERQFQIAVDQAYTYAHALAGKEEQNNSYT